MKNTKLKKYLFERGISQKSVAIGAIFTFSNISLLCSGSMDLSHKSLKKLCMFLKCSPNDILDWEKWIDATDKKKKTKK